MIKIPFRKTGLKGAIHPRLHLIEIFYHKERKNAIPFQDFLRKIFYTFTYTP
jgi:hypothetical protein